MFPDARSDARARSLVARGGVFASRRRVCRHRGRAIGRGGGAAAVQGRWSISPTPCRRSFRPSTACPASRCRSIRFEGRLQPEPVEADRACRHASRCADPFLGGRHHRRADPRRDAGGAARGRSMSRQGGEGSRLSAVARRPRPGSAGTGGCRTTAVSRCIPAGRGTSPTRPSTPARTRAACSISRASRPSRRMAAEGAQGRGHRGRHAVARPRAVEGFQDPHDWLPRGPLGSRERRQSGQVPAAARHWWSALPR